MSEKIIRDPVHDVIAFRLDEPDEQLLFDLINTTEFQRLRRVRQLGLATLAYPGAEHSRYSHSLGVMAVCRQMLDLLERWYPIDRNQRLLILCGALLHDLGHGPFSHVFERVTGLGHEDLGRRLILDPDSQVNQVLSKFDPQLPADVADLLAARGKRGFQHDMLASQLDADRIDYLLRDNLMTGSRYGEFDLQWLLRMLVIDPASGRLCVTTKGVSAVEGYLQARYHMYRNVYFHKVVRSAEGMVRLALQRARRLAIQERLDWPRPEDPFYRALLGQRLSPSEFSELDDVSVMSCFKVWRQCDDEVLARLCDGLLFRKVYKTIDLSRIQDPLEVRAVVSSIEQAITAEGEDAAYALFYEEPSETPYEIYAPDAQSLSRQILIRDSSGTLTEFSELSPEAQVLNRQLMFRRVHIDPKWRAIAIKCCGL